MNQETSIAFQTDKTPGQYRELAEIIDGYGFDVVSVYGDLPYQPSFEALLLMAPYLHTARIGPACVSPSRMAPLDMAGSVALLDHVTNGRAYLGIARGAWLAQHGVHEPTTPIAAIRESIEIVQKLLSGVQGDSEGGYAGKVYHIAPTVRLPYPVLRAPVPILIGTWGEKLAAVAGELADEVKIGGSANAALIPIMQGWIAAGEQIAKRTVGTVGIVLGAVTVVDEDGAAARAFVKRDLALYLPVVATLDPSLRLDPELIARIGALVDQHQPDAAAALISDDLLSKVAFAGTPEQVIEQAQALYDAGAARVEFGTPHGIDSARGIHLLGQRVLPNLQLQRT